jgi:hypothetical protein
MSRALRAEQHQGSLQIPREGAVPNMSIFRPFAILLMVPLILPGVFILYDSMARRSAPASGSLLAGAVLFSLALPFLHFLSRPAVI